MLAGASGLWLIAQGLFGDSLFERIGYTLYAGDLIAILVLVAGLAVALLFARYQHVKSDLLAGRNVIAHWQADPKSFEAFAAVADARQGKDALGMLLVVFFFVIVIFGAFALFDPDAAPFMLAVAGGLMAVLVVAYLLGSRGRKKQLEPRSREVIVGKDGLLVNDVLHVWRTPLSWFSGVSIEGGSPALMTVTYAFLARYGVQFVDVMVPVPADAMPLAKKVEQTLNTGSRKRRARPRATHKQAG